MTHENFRLTTHPVLPVRRGKKISFSFNGRRITAYEGETVAAALYAAGVRIFSRSFKYHRPRGLLCLNGHCAHCLMRVDGIPNVRVCREKVRAGMVVQSQNAWPSLKLDLSAVTGYLDFLFRPGFQYRYFKKNRPLYHLWEKMLRRAAGIGKLPDMPDAQPARHVRKDVPIAVVGAGVAGLSAALAAAESGAEVLLIEREDVPGGRRLYDTTRQTFAPTSQPEEACLAVRRLAESAANHTGIRTLTAATAFAWYDEGILAVSAPGELWEITAQRTVVCSGVYQTPMLFADNDLPGIFLSGGIRRLISRDFILPGKRAVVLTDNDAGSAAAAELVDLGLPVAAVVDIRDPAAIEAGKAGRRLRRRRIPLYAGHRIVKALGRRTLRGVKTAAVSSNRSAGNGARRGRIACDVLCVASAPYPANELVFQRSCQGAYVLESPHQITRKPSHNASLKVADDMYAAGGANGAYQMAQSALEGRVAGFSAAIDLGCGSAAVRVRRDQAMEQLPRHTLPAGDDPHH